MKVPQIELLPLRAAVVSDHPCTIDVLVRIVAPTAPDDLKRPTLNLGFALDRSGSMSSQRKIEFARQATCYAVQQLTVKDRISVTIFDEQVQTLVSSTLATEPAQITAQIAQIQPRGSTALHAGWLESGIQVSQHLNLEHLNRVILLSDGLANVGETNPDTIASDVHGLAQRGVSTTTMGVGNDYNEDLLEAMTRSGNGNYYYIESPKQLPDIFQTELQGLMATVGHTVSLGIEPQGGVKVIDVLNDLERNRYGRYQLPNLIVGNKIEIIVRLKIPVMTVQAADICHFRLAWDDPQQPQRQKVRTALHLPVVSSAQLADFPLVLEVQQLSARLMAARAKQEAVSNIDRGDYAAARLSLEAARAHVTAVPTSAMLVQELEALDTLATNLASGDLKRMRKQATYQNYQMRRSLDLSS
ncbi:MAG: VWA domain-containing protein [Chroococcidiopsidaceae cyanobacterium CP_BM_RX_35]|nr:VWA domain-containing protein [Chroococcidiopsidaceae cyanobacterium CP_BM_RX_35]